MSVDDRSWQLPTDISSTLDLLIVQTKTSLPFPHFPDLARTRVAVMSGKPTIITPNNQNNPESSGAESLRRSERTTTCVLFKPAHLCLRFLSGSLCTSPVDEGPEQQPDGPLHVFGAQPAPLVPDQQARDVQGHLGQRRLRSCVEKGIKTTKNTEHHRAAAFRA